MSVTVADLLALPSLREARVLGGRGGLTKLVASISVLESTDPGYLVNKVFPSGEFFNSEIVITGFLNIPEDVDCQLANMRRLAEGGEVGLILYYVGVYMPRVDQRLIDLADALDFVLICMPEGQRELRYGEVISDVTACIYRDRMRRESIVSELLARVSRLPAHQRTVNTVLKMLSDRVSASVVLRDGAGRVLNLVAWPRMLESEIQRGVATLPPLPEGTSACGFLPEGRIHRFPMEAGRSRLELLLIKEGLPLEEELLAQAADVVRLSVNIWGEQHGEVAVHELVRAILQDDPMKMHRLAEIFHIDVAALHEMWVLWGERRDLPALMEQRMEELRGAAEACSDTVVADLYEGRLLLFLDTPGSLTEARRQMEALLDRCRRWDPTVTLTRCGGLGNTGDVRRAYLCHQGYLADVRRIFPRRSLFGLGELHFARECRSLIDEGEGAVEDCLAALRELRTDNGELDLAATLTAYLLDGDASVTATAALLFLHKNTVKYRIQRISELLGFRPDKMPEGIKLYKAAAVKRLLD